MAKDESNTVIRAVTLPVGVPLGNDAGGKPWSWESLNAALMVAFRLSTDTANWCIHQMFARDTMNAAKMPTAVKPKSKANPDGFYSYAEYGKAFPNYREQWKGATQSLNICLRYAERKYREDRYAVMVRHDNNLLTVRYPYPFPVDADAWRMRYDDGGFPVVTVTLPGVGQVDLRLKRRADFGRQLAMFKQLHDGVAKKGEAALYRNGKGDLLLKLVGHFPKRPRGEAVNVCYLHTDPAALLVAEINGRKVTITNGDHLKRWEVANRKQEQKYEAGVIAGKTPAIPPHRGGGPIPTANLPSTQETHKSYLQRAREDKKREVRMNRRQRAHLNKATDIRCEKHRHRMDTAVKQIAAQVVRMCQRQSVGLIAYDDDDKSFIPGGFPWHALKTRLQQVFVGEMNGEWIDGQFTQLKDDTEKQEWLRRAKATATAGQRAVANANRNGSHPKVTKPVKSKASPSPRQTSKPANVRP